MSQDVLYIKQALVCCRIEYAMALKAVCVKLFSGWTGFLFCHNPHKMLLNRTGKDRTVAINPRSGHAVLKEIKAARETIKVTAVR